MKKIVLSVFIFLGLSLLFTKKALAMCPLCAVAVGAGISLSRYLGIDDSITGLWVGGLVISFVTWTIDWFDRKNINFRFRNFLTFIFYYLITIIPLYFMGVLGNPSHAVLGKWIDKLSIGIILGSISFWFAAEWYYFLKEKNNGKAYFPFQKVVMPVGVLVVLSFVFYFLTK